jgi:hypothetical protein
VLCFILFVTGYLTEFFINLKVAQHKMTCDCECVYQTGKDKVGNDRVVAYFK